MSGGHICRGQGEGAVPGDRVEAGPGVEVVDLDGVEAVVRAAFDDRADDLEDRCTSGGGGGVEDDLVGPVGVAYGIAGGITEHGRRMAGPVGAGLSLEAVDVADVVGALDGLGGGVAGDHIDRGAVGQLIGDAAELVVEDTVGGWEIGRRVGRRRSGRSAGHQGEQGERSDKCDEGRAADDSPALRMCA